MNAIVFEERRGRGQKVVAYSDIIFTLLNLFQVSLMIRWYRNLSLYIIILSLYCRNISFFSSGEISSEQVVDFWTLPFIFPKTIEFIPSGANKQKIKIIDHNKCNVRASKNAEQAFSTQRYLYISCGLFFLFSSVLSQWIK